MNHSVFLAEKKLHIVFERNIRYSKNKMQIVWLLHQYLSLAKFCRCFLHKDLGFFDGSIIRKGVYALSRMLCLGGHRIGRVRQRSQGSPSHSEHGRRRIIFCYCPKYQYYQDCCNKCANHYFHLRIPLLYYQKSSPDPLEESRETSESDVCILFSPGEGAWCNRLPVLVIYFLLRLCSSRFCISIAATKGSAMATVCAQMPRLTGSSANVFCIRGLYVANRCNR